MKTKSNKKLNKSPFLKGDVRRTGGLAFTLFELLVSISIIGILIAVASLSYGTAQKKARDARRIEDLNSIQKAMEMYYSQNSGSYLGPNPLNVVPNYLQSWPKNPKGSDYSYTYTGTTTYCVGVSMDSPNGNCDSTGCLNMNNPTNKGYYCVKNQQ